MGGAVVLSLSSVLSSSVAAVSAPYLSPSTAFGPITGSGNCSTNGTLEQPVRDAADAQLAGFLATAARDTHSTALFPDGDIGNLGSTPYAVAIPDTDVVAQIALHNMTEADTTGATSLAAMSWGSPATGNEPSLLFGSTQQLQDCAPKPTRLVSTAEGGPLATPTAYWNVSGFGSALDGATRDSVLFTFSEPIDNFGAWFGDLETRSDDVGGGDGGALGYLKLYDAAGAVLAVQPIVPNVQTPIDPGTTPFGCGGSSSADPSACGNHGTRFLGFTWDTPDVAAFQVIVGDDDNCDNVPTDCDGTSERLSFIGPSYAFDNPQLTFDKVVINDNFGTGVPADFTFELITDPNGSPATSTHVAGDTVDLQIGTEYAVREVAESGYVNTAVVCETDENSSADAVDVPVDAAAFTPTLGNAQFACTFTNDDASVSIPLTVTKLVVNDDDGVAVPGDFELSVTVGSLTSSLVSGATLDLTSPAEVTVTEVPVDGYSLISVECSDAANNDLGSAFTPDPAMVSVSCVVTNDDIAPAPTTTTTTDTAPVVTDAPPVTVAPTGPPTTAAPSVPASVDPTVELPATGGDAGSSLRIAVGLLAVGLALTALARRRTLS